MEPSAVNFLGHLSFFVTTISFLMKDIILLRALAIVSSAFGIIYNYHVTSEPLWLVIFWLLLFFIINSYQIVRTVLDQRSINLTEKERYVHGNSFGSFSALEFKRLLDIGEWKNSPPGDVLASENEEFGELNFIYSGEVSISRKNQELARLRSGSLIGEISYLKGKSATATATTTEETVYICWKHKKLRSLLSKNPMMNVSMMAVLNSDLIKKLQG